MNFLFRMIPNVGPFVIIGGLLAAAFLYDPSPELPVIDEVPLAMRDRFYGAVTPAPEVIWLAGGAGKIVRTDDAGENWHIQATPTKEHLQDIATWSTDQAIVVGNRGIVLLTGDAGETWEEIKIPEFGVDHKLMQVLALPGGTAWAIGAMSTVMVSADYGRTWETKVEQRDHIWNDIAFADENLGMVVGEFGKALLTTDGGTTWEALGDVLEKSMAAIAFHDPQNAIAVGVEGSVMRSRDGGRTWRAVATGTPEHLYEVAWLDDNWVAAGDKGTFVFGSLDSDEVELKEPGVLDYLWHTKLVPGDGQFLASGATVGILRAGEWHPFKSQ